MMVCPRRLLVLVLAVLPVQAAGVEALAGGVWRGTGDTSVQGEPRTASETCRELSEHSPYY